MYRAHITLFLILAVSYWHNIMVLNSAYLLSDIIQCKQNHSYINKRKCVYLSVFAANYNGLNEHLNHLSMSVHSKKKN